MLLDQVVTGALADISNVLTTRMHVPLLAATVATNCITVQTTLPASVPNVVPIPRKRVMGMPAVTLVAHAAPMTPAVSPATSAAMTLSEDAVLLDLRASQILTNVPLQDQVVEVEAEVAELLSRLLLLPSQRCCQEPLLPAL
jgi:hypothetical protein